MCAVELKLAYEPKNWFREMQFFSYQVFMFLLIQDLEVEVLKASEFNKSTFHQSKKVLRKYNDGKSSYSYSTNLNQMAVPRKVL